MDAGRLTLAHPLTRVTSFSVAALGCQRPSCPTLRDQSPENKATQKQTEPRAGKEGNLIK